MPKFICKEQQIMLGSYFSVGDTMRANNNQYWVRQIELVLSNTLFSVDVTRVYIS